LECLTPDPEPTPTYRLWKAKGEYSISCPVCELTDFGGDVQFYTDYSVSTLDTGIYLYENSSLTTPFTVTYIKVLQTQNINQTEKIFEVDSMGKITFKCDVNGNC
jgi:hypothetical protein